MTSTAAGGLGGPPGGALCGIRSVFSSQLDGDTGLGRKITERKSPAMTPRRDAPATWRAPAGADLGRLAEVCPVCQESPWYPSSILVLHFWEAVTPLSSGFLSVPVASPSWSWLMPPPQSSGRPPRGSEAPSPLPRLPQWPQQHRSGHGELHAAGGSWPLIGLSWSPNL